MKEPGRPNPDELLDRAEHENRRATRGRLKVFLGACPGVGKTYAMLSAAHRLAREGTGVVVGVVETHGRAETESLLLGLDVAPRRDVAYRGTVLHEFDLDWALERKPELLLVDELAHTNAPGSRFEKRWQDVRMLLEAGINVATTVNVQHLESVNDIVEQITGVAVQETVPDHVLEMADEVELVDVTPDVMLERLREGKVYVPEAARHALAGFFRRGNLIALRELSLRRTAEWVDAQMREYKRENLPAGGAGRVWAASERIVVGIGPSPMSASLLRSAKRLAVALRAELIAVYVETSRAAEMPVADHERVMRTLRLAESLGAEAVTLGTDGRLGVSEEIIAYAKSRNATKIVVGQPRTPKWQGVLAAFGLARASPVDALVRESGDVEVVVLRASAQLDAEDQEERARGSARSEGPPQSRGFAWRGYAEALAVVLVVTGIGVLMFRRFDLANIVMVYLLGVVVIAARNGRWPAIAASVLGVAAFDFAFVPPHLTFAVSDTQYLVTFAVMLGVGLFISTLTTRIRDDAVLSRERERRTASLYSMSRELAASRVVEDMVPAAARRVREVFDGGLAVFAAGADGTLEPFADPAAVSLDEADMAVVRWAKDHSRAAGLGTGVLPASRVLCLPMRTSRGTIGVVVFRPNAEGTALPPRQFHLLETYVDQIALSLERVTLLAEAQESRLREQTERTRNALLSSVSHDLRTPLAVIAGAASSLREDSARLDEQTKAGLAEAIYTEAARLNDLIANLMFATRLEAGVVEVKRDWVSVEEIVGSVRGRMKERLVGRAVTVRIPADLPLILGDAVLLEQVVLNLLENALRHTPAETKIEIDAWSTGSSVVMQVSDEGPGLAKGEESQVFDRFYRGASQRNEGGAENGSGAGGGGMGLGLAICRGIVTAHGGRIWAENRSPRGVAFRVALPKPPPPALDALTIEQRA